MVGRVVEGEAGRSEGPPSSFLVAPPHLRALRSMQVSPPLQNLQGTLPECLSGFQGGWQGPFGVCADRELQESLEIVAHDPPELLELPEHRICDQQG